MLNINKGYAGYFTYRQKFENPSNKACRKVQKAAVGVRKVEVFLQPCDRMGSYRVTKS